MARIASSTNYEWLLLAEYYLAGERGDTQLAVEGAHFVVDCVGKLNLPKARLARLETAVQEAVNNLFQRSMPSGPPLPLEIRVFVPEDGSVNGSQRARPHPAVHVEEIPGRAWNAGRGWGFFLVEKGADTAQSAPRNLAEHSGNLDGDFGKSNTPIPPRLALHHAIDVFLYLEGESAG